MSEQIKNIVVLYVEDDKSVRDGLNRTLQRLCKKLYVAQDGQEGIDIYKTYYNEIDVVISDINMPKKNGIDMVNEMRTIKEDQAIIYTTAHTESQYTLEALNMQVDGYIVKPIDKKILKSNLLKISKQILLKKENSRTQKLLQKILDNQTSITILTDFNTIEFASKSFYELFALKNKEEFLATHKNILDIFVNHKNYISSTTKNEFLKIYYETKLENRIVSIPATLGNVKAFYIEIDKVDTLFLVTLTDITEIHKTRLQNEYKATYDKLTGLFNRVKFEEYFESAYQRVLRYKKHLCLAIIDIDHFKNINDTYGHQIGDEILKELAKICLKSIRKTDIFARWGGEEFALIMEDTSLEDAKKACEKLRKVVEELKIPTLPKITISIGISKINHKDTKETFFKRADEALYRAKENGRNMVVVN